jgi:hypothetical protein
MFDDPPQPKCPDLKHLLAGRRWRPPSTGWWLLVFACHGLALLGLFFGTSYQPPDTSWATYEKITEAMTERQVQRLFGVPPGGYGGGLFNPARSHTQQWTKPVHYTREWGSRHGIIAVGFDDNSKVCRKYFLGYRAGQIKRQAAERQHRIDWLFGGCFRKAGTTVIYTTF